MKYIYPKFILYSLRVRYVSRGEIALEFIMNVVTPLSFFESDIRYIITVDTYHEYYVMCS